MHEKKWYIITKDKAGLTGLWRKLTKDPSYAEFVADITSISGDADVSTEITPLVKALNGRTRTSAVIQARNSEDAIMEAYCAQFLNAGQRSHLFKKIGEAHLAIPTSQQIAKKRQCDRKR